MKFHELPIETKEKIIELADKHKWEFVKKEYPYMLRITKMFKYSLVKMNIYWDGRGRIKNVCTHMKHPKKGRGQIYRRINLDELESYIINPRKHTKKGYGRSLN